MPVVLNAANEVAVEAFLQERIGFTAISDVIAATMGAHTAAPAATLADRARRRSVGARVLPRPGGHARG